MTDSKTPAEILRLAAQRVRQGWCTVEFDDGDGRHCALGALEIECKSRGCSWSQARYALMDALNIASVALWNDAQRDGEAVAQGLERAADWWEAQQVPVVEWTHRDKELVQS